MSEEFQFTEATVSAASDKLLTREDEVRLAKLIEAGVLAESALLHRDDQSAPGAQIPEVELRELAAIGKRAFDEFVTRNLRLVRSIANRHAKHSGPSAASAEDFQQEGVQGLIRAIEKYDFKRGFKFSTYATDQIEAAIRRAKNEQTRTIRLPEAEAALAHRVRRYEQDFAQENGRHPSPEEIAVALNIAPTKVKTVQRHAASLRSLNEPVGSDEHSEFGALISDVPDNDPAIQVAQRSVGNLDLKAWQAAFKSAGLRPDEATVVSARLGLLDGETKTLTQTARLISTDNKARMRTADLLAVRKIEISALAKLGASDIPGRLRDQR